MRTAARPCPPNPSERKSQARGKSPYPLEIRRSLGIKPGDHLRFEQKKNGISLVRDTEENVFEKWRGIGTGFQIPGNDKAALVGIL